MIKIIKEGTRKAAKCEYCGCEFSYEDEDIQHVNHGYKKYVVCPQCKKEFVVEQTRAN